MIFYTN